MSAMSDATSWLSSPAGRVYTAANGGYSAALASLVQSDNDRHRAAYSLNTSRMASGLPALARDAALAAVSGNHGIEVSGTSAELVKEFSSDPMHPWGFSSEPPPEIPARMIA